MPCTSTASPHPTDPLRGPHMTVNQDQVLAALQGQAADPARRILIKGAQVVSMDPAFGERTADVLIMGDTIAAVGPDATADTGADAVVIDATGCVLIPGLVDSHVHAW